MVIKAALLAIATAFAALALSWFAGAAADAGLAAYVVVTWWSFGVLFALLSLICAGVALIKLK